MRADPEDVDLKYLCGDMYRNLHNYQKAAEIYEQIVRIYPSNIAVRKISAQVYCSGSFLWLLLETKSIVSGLVYHYHTGNWHCVGVYQSRHVARVTC